VSFISGKRSLSTIHSCNLCLKILVDLGGILACEYLEEHMYGVLGTATIRFGRSCASGWFA